MAIRTDCGYEAFGWSATDLDPPTKVATVTRSGIWGRSNSIPEFLDITRRDVLAQDKKKTFPIKRLCHYFVSIVFSALSSLVLVIGYVVGGAYLFIYLEGGNELSKCKNLEGEFNSMISSTVNRLVAYASSGVSNSTWLTENMQKVVLDYSGEFYKLDRDPTADCSSLGTDENPYAWNILNTIYFTLSIVTTIGYGHLFPLTDWGKIICCIYAVLGMPIMLLFLAKIGDVLTRAFLSGYYNFCCFKFYLRTMNYTVWREQGRIDGAQERQVAMAAANDKLQLENIGGVVVVQEVEEETRFPFDFIDEEEDPQFTVPISVAILVLVLYMMIGVALFTSWEASWTATDAAYFSFITMSTIGFGDIVPGRDLYFNAPGGMAELIVGSIYTIGGLAVLAMCVNLIQETMSEKIDWFNRKLGFVKDLDELEELEREEEMMEQDMMGSVVDNQGDRKPLATQPSGQFYSSTVVDASTGSTLRLKASRSRVAINEPPPFSDEKAPVGQKGLH